MCYNAFRGEFIMEQTNIPQETPEQESYHPRPAWQVWVARIALVIVLIGIIGYYLQIAHKY